MDTSIREDETPDNGSMISESYNDFESQLTNSRKRRRIDYQMSEQDKQHHLWADDLLDYFMLQEDPRDAQSAPTPPANANLDRPIDDKGHTALHWAAAMGDLSLVRDLIRRGARIDVQSKNGETPLMRAVIFTNCFDRQNMDKVGSQLIRTVNMQEWSGSTVFHHIANTVQRKSKYQCARYYMDCLLNKMPEVMQPQDMERILNRPDQAGDTAITIAARHGARKCVRALIGRNAAVDIPNNLGETADQLIVQLNHRRQERAHTNDRHLSSSPFQPDSHHIGGAVQPPNGMHLDPLLNGASRTNGHGHPHDVYKSESALAITTQVMPILISKAKELATSIDQEIAEKDAELLEAERVVASRRQEIDQLKRQQEELRLKEAEQLAESGGLEADGRMDQQLATLQSEARELERELQDVAQQKLLVEETAKQQASPPDSLVEAGRDDEGLIREKLELVRQIIGMKKQQKELIEQIVANMSLADLSKGGATIQTGANGASTAFVADRQALYRRLITGALNIREEDVEGMLPEIVQELEEWRGLESVGA